MRVRVVEGSVDGSEFFNFIVDDVVRTIFFARIISLWFICHFQLPRMNRWPADNSVLVMDNCAIHKAQSLRTVIEASGVYATNRNIAECSPDITILYHRLSALIYSSLLARLQSDRRKLQFL